MDERYTFGEKPTYIPEIEKNCYWEAIITDNELRIVRRGGPLEPIILQVKGKDLEVEDWWGWGQG